MRHFVFFLYEIKVILNLIEKCFIVIIKIKKMFMYIFYLFNKNEGGVDINLNSSFDKSFEFNDIIECR